MAKKFDSLREAGLEEVRRRLATDVYGEAGNRRAVAASWVAEEERKLDAEAQRARDAKARVADAAGRLAGRRLNKHFAAGRQEMALFVVTLCYLALQRSERCQFLAQFPSQRVTRE